MPVTFLVTLPFVHVIVIFLEILALLSIFGITITELLTGGGVVFCIGSFFSWESVTLRVGLENSNPLADNNTNPFFSSKDVVATCVWPLAETTETDA